METERSDNEQYRGFLITYRITGFGGVEAVVRNGRGERILEAGGTLIEDTRRAIHNRVDYHLSDGRK